MFKAEDEQHIRDLLVTIDPNPEREGLVETPKRFLKAMEFWTSGYGKEPSDVLKVFEDGAQNYDEFVFQSGIVTYSLCEHHLAPFFGVTHIGYLPRGKVVGLSKLSRLVDIFSRRLQVQERLGVQIADALMNNLDCRGVGVVIQCRHMCMESRGVQKPGTISMTSALRGDVKTSPELRSEFMSLVNIASERHSYL